LKFKIDENLPTEYAPILREAGFEADTVSDEKLSGAGDSVLSERCRAEDRVLMTLDLDFANVQAYPPKSIRESWSFALSPRTSQRLLLF
jgi:predicted nuclease of predicted toxin-antitoxin system